MTSFLLLTLKPPIAVVQQKGSHQMVSLAFQGLTKENMLPS